ncbi:MAG: hypothetical protein KC609_21635, partial [Myxococcales bacterium]|nr:hypothetical protein [Myxococcales bacterium]
METRIFGVRHHGPGCAKALRRELARFEPDRLLVEGPPEGDELLALLDDDLEPPVAILCYRPDEPRQAIFFPFARFSPEWQALQYARERAVPAQFFDLPVGQRFAFIESGRSAGAAEGESLDPLAELALAAGYDDDDRFWEEWFEQRERTSGVFEAIAEAMRSVRDVPTGSAPSTRAESTWEASLESIREAQMRLRMRLAEKDGTQRLAVVCGAWHVPALERMPPQREDRARLRGLRKLKVASTFVPWTYRRLGVASGYGAGVRAPGWYDHLWRYGADAPAAWLARVGHELRRIHRDVAPASAIDALRLADALAAMRAQPRPGYRELMDAAQSVFCEGEGALLEIVERTVAVGERIGR